MGDFTEEWGEKGKSNKQTVFRFVNSHEEKESEKDTVRNTVVGSVPWSCFVGVMGF